MNAKEIERKLTEIWQVVEGDKDSNQTMSVKLENERMAHKLEQVNLHTNTKGNIKKWVLVSLFSHDKKIIHRIIQYRLELHKEMPDIQAGFKNTLLLRCIG